MNLFTFIASFMNLYTVHPLYKLGIVLSFLNYCSFTYNALIHYSFLHESLHNNWNI